MTNLVLLNTVTHRDLQVDASPSAALGDSERFVPVIVGEFPALTLQYPIMLSKSAETGAFFCGAMLGFELGENLFLDQAKGYDGYRPLFLQRLPFYTVGSQLAVDLDSPRVNPAHGGRAVFNESGEPTPYLESIFATMRELTPGTERTKAFVDELVSLRLIEPVEVKLSFDDGNALDVTGLYTIDRAALQDLPDDKVLDLFRRGYLHLIYLMIASMKHIHTLARRKNDALLAGTEGLGRGLS